MHALGYIRGCFKGVVSNAVAKAPGMGSLPSLAFIDRGGGGGGQSIKRKCGRGFSHNVDHNVEQVRVFFRDNLFFRR